MSLHPKKLAAHLAEGSPFLKALTDLIDWHSKFEDHLPKVAVGGQELNGVCSAMHAHLSSTSKITRNLDIDGFFSSAADLRHLLTDLLPEVNLGEISRLLDELATLRKLFSAYIAYQSSQNALPLLLSARNFGQRLKSFQTDLSSFSILVGAQDTPGIGEAELSLIFESSQSFRSFWEKLRAIDEIYEDLCHLLDEEEITLRILKIESGSELIRLIGNAAVIGVISKVLYDAGRFIHRNYTREGRIAQTTQELKQVNALWETIKKFKKGNVDVGEAEAQVGMALQRIIGSFQLMVGKESSFVVGGQRVSPDEDNVRLRLKKPLQLKDANPLAITDERPKSE